MRDYQIELDSLRERIAKRQRDQSVLVNLRIREERYIHEVEKRRAQWLMEQKDVERLERVSLASVLAALRGSKDEDLAREQAEVRAAQLYLQEAERQLEDVRHEIGLRQRAVHEADGCQVEYEALLREKEAEYREKDPAFAGKMADLERRELQATTQRRELEEALAAGRQAADRLDATLGKLGSAQNWGVWDLVSDGVMGDIMKYHSLDKAQQQIQLLSDELRRFQMELADVSWVENFSVRPGYGLELADYFFDNIFTDWAVQNRIEQSKQELLDLWSQLQNALRRLERQLMDTDAALRSLQKEREELVCKA